MAVSIIGIDKIAPELRQTFADLGDRAIFLLAKKVTAEAKKNAPLLTSYGESNRNAFPHKYKAYRGAIKRSIRTVPSVKMKYSYLVNARDWRARFVEYGTKPHTMPKSKGSSRRTKYKFLGVNGRPVFRKRINHPGTQGAKFLERASSDRNINMFLDDVISEINNGK